MTEFEGIRIENDEIIGIQGGKSYRTIKLADTSMISLRYSFLSNNIYIQSIMGGALCLFGIAAAIFLASWAINGGRADEFHFIALLCIPAGAWLIYDSFKKGYCIYVRNGTKLEKLTFNGSANKDAVIEFLKNASESHKINIHFDLL